MSFMASAVDRLRVGFVSMLRQVVEARHASALTRYAWSLRLGPQ